MVQLTRSERFSALQSLRGIAAAVVLIQHATACYPDPSGTSFELEVLFNSHAAVVVFFVLSGFVLSASLERRSASFAVFAAFYTKRLFRIVPLLIVMTVLGALFMISRFSAGDIPGTASIFSGNMRHGSLKAVDLVLGFAALNSHYVPQNWTILVELLIAPIFPVLFFIARSSSKALAVMLVIGTFASFAARSGGHWLPVVYANDFLIGISVYLLWFNKTFAPRHVGWAAIVAAPLLITARPWLILLHLPRVNPYSFHDPMTGLLEALSAAVIILALTSEGWVTRQLSRRIPVFVGDISYSLYLVHFLVMILLVRVFARLGPSFNGQSGLTKGAILAGSVLVVSLLASAVLFSAVEMPFNRLGKRLASFERSPPGQKSTLPSATNGERSKAG